MLRNVFDYLDAQGIPDVQAALDAAQDGDRVYLPGARVYQAPAGGWIIRTRIEFFGDGPGKKDSYLGTVLVAGGEDDPVLVLDAPNDEDLTNIHPHDFQITRPQGESGRYGGDGIMYQPPPPPPPPPEPDPMIDKKVSQLVIERVAVFHLGGSAFSFLGANGGDSAIVDLHMVDCIAEDCAKYGLTLKFGFGTNLMHCLFKDNGKSGVKAESSGVALYQCVLDGNTRDESSDTEASLHFLNCHTARVEACRLLNFTVGAGVGVLKKACTCTSDVGQASGGALVIGGCHFEVASGATNGIGVHVPGLRPENGPILLLPNRFFRVTTLVDVGAKVTGCVVMPQYDESTGTIAVPASPNAGLNAVLHVNRPGANATSGATIPSPDPEVGSSDPTLNLENGTIAWDSSNAELHVRQAGAWKRVVTS